METKTRHTLFASLAYSAAAKGARDIETEKKKRDGFSMETL